MITNTFLEETNSPQDFSSQGSLEEAMNQKQDPIESHVFDEMSVVELKIFIERSNGWEDECRKISECLHQYGICIVRDPRVNESDNEAYIDLMEQYFAKTSKQLYEGEKLKDTRPEYHYLTGVTPEKIERARNHYERVKNLPEEDLPRTTFPPQYDAKWRYQWKIGERLSENSNYPQVVPEGYQDWELKMNTWGEKMFQAVITASEMAAVGLGLEDCSFSSRLRGGPHLLAPTGSDLQKYGLDTSLAGFHYDFSFMTIHGKSRYPGLYVWLRNWKKVAVKIPAGCLFIQAGSTFEHITGGYILAGFHEVIVSEQTVATADKVKYDN